MNFNKREFQVGILFIAGLILLFVFTITISKLEIFNRPHYHTVIFDAISGLKKGDTIHVSGMEIGSVFSTELLPDSRIKVVLKLRQPIKLYKDYKIQIQELSQLGGNFISIAQGTPETGELEPNTPLKGTATLPPLEKLGQLAAEYQDDIRNLFNEGSAIIEKIGRGEGSLGKLIQDDTLYNNLKDSSESLEKILKQIEQGKGLIGKLLFDEKLSEQVSEASDAATKILKPVMETQVFAGVDAKYYAESKATITKVFIKIVPTEWRYFYLGGSFISLDKDGVVDFEDKQKDNKNQTFIKPDLQLGYIFPWGEQRFTFRPGLLEGKLGAGLDWEIPVTTTGLFPINITVEGRDAFNSVDDEDIDENLRGGLFRAYTTIKISRYFQAYLGASRLFNNDVEFMGGFCFTYPDDEIKNFIVLLGLAR